MQSNIRPVKLRLCSLHSPVHTPFKALTQEEGICKHAEIIQYTSKLYVLISNSNQIGAACSCQRIDQGTTHAIDDVGWPLFIELEDRLHHADLRRCRVKPTKRGPIVGHDSRSQYV